MQQARTGEASQWQEKKAGNERPPLIEMVKSIYKKMVREVLPSQCRESMVPCFQWYGAVFREVASPAPVVQACCLRYLVGGGAQSR